MYEVEWKGMRVTDAAVDWTVDWTGMVDWEPEGVFATQGD